MGIDPIQYFKDLLKRFEDKPDETHWGKVHNATSRDMIIQAIAALEQQKPTEPCDFCVRLDEENIECCIAGEDFVEPVFCPKCGRKLEG